MAAGPLVRSSYHADQHVPQHEPGIGPLAARSPHDSRRRSSWSSGCAIALAALVLAPTALASAGGGSAGFGGGGGGEGGGGGGSGVGVFIIIQILFRIAVLGHGLGALVLIALFIAYLVITRVMPNAQRSWSARSASGPKARRRSAQRQRRVEAAAAEAAEDDAAFAPDAVKANATALFKQDPGRVGPQ